MPVNKSSESLIEGVLPIWKPTGWTSHDVVAKARRILGIRRIGHTGTLDPAVTGVLPLCIGRATRLVEYLQELPKTYEATLRFGIATDTEDLSGNIVAQADVSHLTAQQVIEAAQSFVGEIMQVPPMVSAVKVDGKRLYELARQGVTIERAARKAFIHELRIIDCRVAENEERELRFSVKCSKGTYIRTLCVDIGRKLGVPAVMAKLVRIESAGIQPEQCLTLEQLAESVAQDELSKWLLDGDVLLDIPATTASGVETLHALQGKSIPMDKLLPQPDRAGAWRLYREDGIFLGIFEADDAERLLRPVKVFHPANGQQAVNSQLNEKSL